MDSKIMRVVMVVFSAFVILCFGWQVYLLFFIPYKTETAELHAYTDEVELTGVALREEQLISETYSGVIQYEVHNAKKIMDGMGIATVFPSRDELIKHNSAQRAAEKIAMLQRLQEQEYAESADITGVGTAVEKEQMQLQYLIQTNQLGSLDSQSGFYQELLRQEKVLKPDVDYSKEIASLQKKVDSLDAPEGSVIHAPVSGYFTNNIDGYEGTMTAEKLGDLSVASVQELYDTKAKKTEKKQIGKVVASTSWKFAAVIRTKDLERIKEKQKVTMVFPGNKISSVEAVVEKIEKQTGEKQSAVLLSSDIMNEQIINLRKETPAIHLSDGKGLRVDRQAVRMVDGQTGVYIKSGNVARFRKINIIYDGDDYVISKVQDSKVEEQRTFLQLYDEIIIEGKGELYDKKPL